MDLYARLLDTATCLVALTSLWVRRNSWRYPWEIAKNFGLAQITLGAILKTLPVAWIINHNTLPGLNLLISHFFILTGIGAIVYSAEHKLRSDATMRSWYLKRLVLPRMTGYAVMVAMYIVGGWHSLKDFQQPSGYAVTYWIVYDVLIIYLLLVGVAALGHLFYDEPSRRMAGIYLIAVGINIAGAICRIISAIEYQTLLMVITLTANALALMIFSAGGAYQWRTRLNEINKRRGEFPGQDVSNITQ